MDRKTPVWNGEKKGGKRCCYRKQAVETGGSRQLVLGQVENDDSVVMGICLAFGCRAGARRSQAAKGRVRQCRFFEILVFDLVGKAAGEEPADTEHVPGGGDGALEASAVFAGSGVAGAVVDRDFDDRMAGAFDEGGDEPMHPGKRE